MLYGLEIFPLSLYLVVQFQFRITFSIFESHLLENRNQIVEQQGIHTFVLIFRLHGYEEQVEHLRILFHEDELQQMPPTERKQASLGLLQSFAERWHRDTYRNDVIHSIGHECHHTKVEKRQEHLDVLLNLLG